MIGVVETGHARALFTSEEMGRFEGIPRAYDCFVGFEGEFLIHVLFMLSCTPLLSCLTDVPFTPACPSSIAPHLHSVSCDDHDHCAAFDLQRIGSYGPDAVQVSLVEGTGSLFLALLLELLGPLYQLQV